VGPACRVAGRSPVKVCGCAARPATGTFPLAGSGTTVFGLWCLPAKPLVSDPSGPLGLWGEGSALMELAPASKAS
jgi:hypothetical protein